MDIPKSDLALLNIARHQWLNRRIQLKIEETVEKQLNGCWIWTGAITPSGYGHIRLSHPRCTAQVHRVSWAAYRGIITEGLFVCHKCDVRLCCNPEHLFLGTTDDNMKDAVNKDRMARGERAPRSILTEEIVKTLRTEDVDLKALSEKLGISMPALNNARNGNKWKYLNEKYPPKRRSIY